MSLPQPVAQVLQQQGIQFDLVDVASQVPAMAGAPAQVHACAVVLQDGVGRVQALIARDSLLDLDALNRFLGRDLSAAPEEGTATLTAPLGLQLIPAVPQVLDMPVIVDRRLFAGDWVVLDAGTVDAAVRLRSAEFQRLIDAGGSSVGSFCVDLASLRPASADTGDDLVAISAAVEKFTTRRIQARLEDTLDFPPLPEIAHRIIQIGADPYASVKDLSQVVELDPSLAAQVVSWASSPYYAAPGKVRSIHDAIVRVLGFDLVMNLALGLALGKTLRLPRDGRYGYRNYWVQAVHCAAMMDGICKAMPSGRRPPLGYAYLAGLLHNFGFLILAELFKPQLQLICRYAEANPHVGHAPSEFLLLGVSREQMASWLLRFWHLPEEVCLAVRCQHDPDAAGEHAMLARVLHVSTRLLRTQGMGSAPLEFIPDKAFEELGIGRADALAVNERIRNSGDELKSIARDLAA